MPVGCGACSSKAQVMTNNTSFAFEVQSTVTEPKAAPPKREPTVVPLPAQQWEEFPKIVSCQILSEAKPGETVNVKSTQYGGFLYTAFSACYGGLHNGSRVHAWMLVPEKLYPHRVYTDTNWDSEVDPDRSRGDYTGFRVKVKGQPMICTKEVHFLRTIPTVKPLTIDEAKAIDNEARKYGWRSHFYGKDAITTWHKLCGHPVVVYERGEDERTGVLLWREGKKNHDLVLNEDHYMHELEAWDTVSESAMTAALTTRTAMQQCSLF